MQYEVTRPSKRLWDRPFVVHALHCAALVRSDCVRLTCAGLSVFEDEILGAQPLGY